MSSSSDEVPNFTGLLLECNDDSSMQDSFSTLGLHSIFSEDDFSLVQKRQKERAQKNKSTGAKLEKFLEQEEEEEESLDGGGEMDLNTLLQKGRSLGINGSVNHRSFSALEGNHGSLTAPEGSTPLFRGNRWLESAGKSVSCRNIGYDVIDQDVDLPGEGQSRWGTSAAPTRPVRSQTQNLDAARESVSSLALSEADDIEGSMQSRILPAASRKDRWNSGMKGMSQSCRHFSIQERDDAEEAARALSELNKRNAVNRRSMLGMGKSLSSRNMLLENVDQRPSLPSRGKMMKSKSVRYFSAREREQQQEQHTSQLGTTNSPTRQGRGGPKRRLPTRAQTVHQLGSQANKNASSLTTMKQHVVVTPGLTSPRNTPQRAKSIRQLGEGRPSPLRRCKTMPKPAGGPSSPVLASPRCPPTRAKSTRQIGQPSPLRRCKTMPKPTEGSSSPALASPRCPPTRAKSTRQVGKPSPLRRCKTMPKPSAVPVPASPGISSPRRLPARAKSTRQLDTEEGERPSPLRRSKTMAPSLNGRPFMSYSRSLSCRDIETDNHVDNSSRWEAANNDKQNLSPTSPKRETSEHCRNIKAPEIDLNNESADLEEERENVARPGLTKSMSGFLKQRVQNEKITKVTEHKVKKEKLKQRKGLGRSMSARNLIGGRKSLKAVGRSRSAHDLRKGAREGGLNGLASIPASPTTPMLSTTGNLSVCMEESQSTYNESSSAAMDDSMPGLSPMMTPQKPKPSSDLLHMSIESLKVEEEMWSSLSNLPLTADNAGGLDSPVPKIEAAPTAKPEETTPVYSTEEMRKEIGLDCAATDVLSPIQESGRSTRKCRLPSKKEVVKKSGAVLQGTQSSLKSALHKTVKAATVERKKSTSQRRRSSASKDGKPVRRSSKTSSSSKQSPAFTRTVSHDSQASSTQSSSYSRAVSLDGKTSSLKPSSKISKPSSLKKALKSKSVGTSGREKKEVKVVRPRRRSEEMGHKAPPSTRWHNKRQSMPEVEAPQEFAMNFESPAPQEFSLNFESVESHCKTLDSGASREKKSLKGPRRLSSSHKQPSSRRVSKNDKQRSSRTLTKKDSQRNISASMPENGRVARQRSSRKLTKKDSQRSMTVSKQRSSRVLTKKESERNLSESETGRVARQRSSRNMTAKKESEISLSASDTGRVGSQRSSRNVTRKEGEMNLSASENGRVARQRSSRNVTKKDSQRNLSASIQDHSRRRGSNGGEKKLAISTHGNSLRRSLRSEQTYSTAEMTLSSSTRGSSTRQAARQQAPSRRSLMEESGRSKSFSRRRGSAKGELRRTKSMRHVKESRAESPSCVANYSAGEKGSPAKGKKTPRKKRKSLSSKLENSNSRRSQKQVEDTVREAQAARLGVNLRDLEFPFGPGHLSRHSSWSTTDFSSVVW